MRAPPVFCAAAGFLSAARAVPGREPGVPGRDPAPYVASCNNQLINYLIASINSARVGNKQVDFVRLLAMIDRRS